MRTAGPAQVPGDESGQYRVSVRVFDPYVGARAPHDRFHEQYGPGHSPLTREVGPDGTVDIELPRT